jgi:hypothetical protein
VLSIEVGYGQLQLNTLVNHHVCVCVCVSQSRSGRDDKVKQNSSLVSRRNEVLRPHAIAKLDENALVISNPIPRPFSGEIAV